MTKEELEKEVEKQAEADYDKMFLQKNETISELQEQNTNLQIMLQAEREVRCNEEYLKKITTLEAQIEKMKCCENCKYNSYWGNELHCNYGLKEALQEDKLVECKNMDKWEIKE